MGMKFSKEAYQILAKGIAKSKHLKELFINQTNIASYGLQELVQGFNECHTIEYLDL